MPIKFSISVKYTVILVAMQLYEQLSYDRAKLMILRVYMVDVSGTDPEGGEWLYSFINFH